MTTRDRTREVRTQRAGAFDIRWITAGLFAVYGVLLTGAGIASTSPEDIEKSAGININLWLGLLMVVAAVLFGAWARWRPVIVATPEPAEEAGTGATDSDQS